MKPVFLPPPFTPSNPVFIHLAEISNRQSQDLRTAAEGRIREFIDAETSEIVEKERAIRHQAESLWKTFRRHLAELQLEPGRHAVRSARSPSRSRDGTTINGIVNSRLTSSSAAIKTFVPTAMSPSARHASPPLPRVSALSASLATSTFRHPRQIQTSLGDITPNADSELSDTPSTGSASSTLVHSMHHAEIGSNVLQFRRNVNEDINTQASYRYFVDLEEDMRRYKQPKEDAKNPEPTEPGPSRLPDASSSKERTKIQVVEAAVETSEPQVEPTPPPRGRDKGKRKVTFDVKPAVVTIVKDEKEAFTGDQGDQTLVHSAKDSPYFPSAEAMFPLDDVVSEGVAETPVHDQQTTLPLLEQPPPRPITIKKRSQIAVGDAFHSLRPASLPAPSHVRPIRSPPGVDSSSSVLASLPKASSPTRTLPQSPNSEPPPPSLLTESDVELLRLVAADTPSHRGAWLQGSENWQSFTSNRNRKSEQEETDEDGAATKSAPLVVTRNTVAADGKAFLVFSYSRLIYHSLDSGDSSALVGSLPIKIKKPEPPKPLSLASYVGQDDPATPLGVTPANNGRKPSSNAIRRAASLEKDRARSMDPGPLDSVAEEDELDDEVEIASTNEEGEKARKQALRILEARSELPEEGMWRSLA